MAKSDISMARPNGLPTTIANLSKLRRIQKLQPRNAAVETKILWIAFAEWRSFASSANGVNTVAGYLEKKYKGQLTQKIWYFDGSSEGEKNFISKLKEYSPNQLWISVTMGNLDKIIRLVETIKASMPPEDFARIKFVFGNREFLKEKNVEELFKTMPNALIVKGYGEVAALEILSGEPIRSIPNLYYFKYGRVRYTFDRSLNKEDYMSPKVNWEVLNPIDMHLDEVVANVEGSRGCSKKSPCFFCYNSGLKPSSRVWTPLNIKEVSKNIVQAARKHPSFVNFVDDNFASDPERLKQVLNEIERLKKEGEISREQNFCASIRANDIYSAKESALASREKVGLLRKMRSLGFNMLFIGIESGSDSQLKRYNKEITRKENLEAIRIMRDSGMHLDGGFIMFDDLLDESLNEITDNISFLRETKVPKFHLFPMFKLNVIPESAYDAMLKRRKNESEKVKKFLSVVDYAEKKINLPALVTLMYKIRELYAENKDIEKIKLFDSLSVGHGEICLNYLEKLVNAFNAGAADEEVKRLTDNFVKDVNIYDKKIEEEIKKFAPDFDKKSDQMKFWKDS